MAQKIQSLQMIINLIFGNLCLIIHLVRASMSLNLDRTML